MFSSSSCTLINNSGHDHQDTENQTPMLQQEYHSSPFLFFHHDPFCLDHENDFLATHDDHQDPHQFLPQNHQLQPQEILLLGSCNDNNGGQEVINPAAAAARSSSSSRGARSTSSNSNNKKKRSISDHGDGAKQPSQRRRSGKKDRHSKIYTAQGPRDRRMRLSLPIARKFFDLQDILGFDKASKTIEWLFTKSKAAIKELTDSNGGKSIITTVISCTSESEVASSSAIIKIPEKSTRSPNNNHEEIKITSKGKKRLHKLPVFNPVGRDRARARARERTKEKMMNNMVKGCSSPPNPSGSNLEQEIMPTTGGEEFQEGECSTDLLLQQEMDSVNLADHHHSKPKLGDASVGSNDSSSFLDLISQQQQQQHGFQGEKEEEEEEEEEEEGFSWYPVNYLDNMMNNTILPQAAAGMQYPFAGFMNVSPIFAQQQRTSSLNLATTSSCIDQGQNNMVSTTTSTSSIFATQESVTLNFSNHHQINNTNTASGILQPHLLENYHLSCNPSYKFGSLF